MSYKKVNPPFGYFGSKNRLALQFCENLPPHNCWVDAFCGSAAMTLAKPPSQIEIINDIDGEIVNLFRQLRDNYEELIELIEFTPYAADELVLARKYNDHDSDVERARKFAVQAMMAINGVFGAAQGGFSVSHAYSRNNREARVNRWNNLPDRLYEVVKRLKNVRIENRDAIELLQKYRHRPATLFYLDPPYLGNRTNGYRIDANDEDFHRNLVTIANDATCMIFISGYDNDLYNEVLTLKNGWQKKAYETHTKGSNGNSQSRTEFVWTNRYYQLAFEENSIQLKLTQKEIKNQKINPERK